MRIQCGWLGLLFCAMLWCHFPLTLMGQVLPSHLQLVNELEKRGISEEDLFLLLEQRNIDLNNLEQLSPSELLELQNAIEALQKKKPNSSSLADRGPLFLDTLKPDQAAMIDDTIASLNTETIDSSHFNVWGKHIFLGNRISVINPKEAYNPPPYYKIGVGDVLSVSIFGRSQLDETHVVYPDGSVMIRNDRVKVFVKGLTLAEARQQLYEKYSLYYRFKPSHFNVQLTTVRNITVQVLGEVVKPGSYTVAAVNGILQLLAQADGITRNGTIRRIKLIKHQGEDQEIDLYALLHNPKDHPPYHLEDGDLIYVPALSHVVDIEGAVRRPFAYELKENEGLIELIQYAGGLQRNAYLPTIKLKRYTPSNRIVKDIPYASLIKNQDNFILKNGDLITVDSISEALENYVSVSGEVRQSGDFERTAGMTLYDLIQKAELKPTAKTDFAFVKRTNTDGTINMIPVSLEDIIYQNDPLANIVLQDKDQLIVWPQERFTDEQYITVAGAVRYDETIPYDDKGALRVADAILMAGGLRRDAAAFAHIHRLDPLNPNARSYVRIDLERVMNDNNSVDNILLEPFDSLHIYSKNDFLDEVTFRISGAVNNPGEFAYGDGMTLQDAIILAGGFKRSAATNNIEVSRVIIKDNQPTTTIVKKVELTRLDLENNDNALPDYALEPFDNVFIRYVPEFELQQNITILGEVKLPGEYSLIQDNETVYDLIHRAGGLTDEAFPLAATLYRSEDSIGYVVMRMEELLKDPQSRYNYTLKGGDRLTIPKRRDYVTIRGATRLDIIENREFSNPDNALRVPYHEGKNAMFYVNYYAGGLADDARADKIIVTHPNGQVRTTERAFIFGRKHPEVLPGSTIFVSAEQEEINTDQKEDVNWTKVLGDSVTQAMSILTLVLLIQRLD